MNNNVLPPQIGKQSRFPGFVIVLSSFLIMMIVWGGNYSFGVFFKSLINEFDWSRSLTSGTYALNLVVFGFFSIFTGRLTDRYGPRLVVTFCGIFVGLSFLLMSRVSAIWQVYLFYSVLGVGLACSMVPIYSSVAKRFTKRRGISTGIVASGIGAGLIIMPPLISHLISNYGWRNSYVITGGIIMLVAVTMAQFLEGVPNPKRLFKYNASKAKADSSNLQVQGFTLREAIRTIQFWIISVAFFITGFSVHALLVHIVPHATDMGMPADAAALILSVIGIISIFSKIGIGSLGDKISNRKSASIVFGIMALSFFLLISSNELWMLYVFAIVFGIGYGGSAVFQSPMIADFFNLRAHGAIFGLTSFTTHIGAATGSIAVGRIFDINGSYYWAFILCTILSLVALLLTILLKNPGK